MMIKHILIIALFFIYSGNAIAQLSVSSELQSDLAGKTGFKDVMATVTSYYTRKNYMGDRKLLSEFKKWNRWAWYESRHLDSEGNFVNSNAKNLPLLNALDRQKKAELRVTAPESNTGVWASIGPYNVANGIGRVDRLAFHPSNPNIMYAGATAGGLWMTNNDGFSWTPLNGYIPQLGVSGIVVDADNPNTLYVLSGDGDSYINGGLVYQRASIGVLKSTDGGNNWTKISNILPEGTTFYGFKLIQSPGFHNRFFACTSRGLFRSTDYGVTWARDATVGDIDVFDVEMVPATNWAYAATSARVFVSSNAGTSFTAVPLGAFSQQPIYVQRCALSISANAPNSLYVLFGGAFTNGSDKLLYRSNDNGTTFTLVSNAAPLITGYACAMTVNPLDINNVIIGNVSVVTSGNGGTSFPNTGTGVHADFHELAYNPINNYLYAATDGGVYRSCCSNGLNWSTSYAGLNITQYYHMAAVNGNDGIAIGGSQDNGTHLRNGSSTFNPVSGGDGFDAMFVAGSADVAYFSLNSSVFKYTVSTNSTVSKLTPGGNINDQNFFFPSIATHPTNSNIIYAGYIANVYRTVNDGVAWTMLAQSGSEGFGSAGGLAVSANVPDRLYAANGTALRRSDNQGDAWTVISGTTGWPAGVRTITDVQTRSNNANEVWVTFGGYVTGKVIYSSNAGASWSDFTGSLPNLPVYCIRYTSNGDAYLGTDAGVYYMGFTMSDWVFFSKGLPMVPVTEIAVNEINGTVKAATFGRGIWQSDTYTACSPLLLLSGTTLGNNFYQASGSIETTQTIPNSYGNAAKYRAPTRITLKPGFKALQNSYMRALPGNCGQGVMRSANGSTAMSKEDYMNGVLEK